jgi:hypothetical protein
VREFSQVLEERAAEITTHLSFMERLDAAATGRGAGGGHLPVDSEPINILKSGFLVHLYNVVEAVMAKILEEIEVEACTHLPAAWCDGLLREWARGRVNLRRDLTVFQAESRVEGLIREAIERDALGSLRIRRKGGNWSNDEVEALADDLGCPLNIAPEIRTSACGAVFENDLSPLKYLRHKRNFLAHGNESFVESARHLTIERLAVLKDVTVAYMRQVSSSFESYLDDQRFLFAV